MQWLVHDVNEQLEAAINAIQESLARDPKNADVYYEMGLVARDQGSQAVAIQFMRKSLHLNPRLWQARSSLGLLLGKQKNFAEALAELNQAKTLVPGEPSIRENLANIYYTKGEYDL